MDGGLRRPRCATIIGVLAGGLAEGAQPDRDVHVFAAHVHVTGAQVTHSERPYTVSDGYAAQAAALPPVAYAAFGHIHRAQILPQASVTGRYAGSPIPLDFGEEHDTKVCLLVEADPGRPAVVTEHPYSIRRPLWRFSGTLAELREQAPAVEHRAVPDRHPHRGARGRARRAGGRAAARRRCCCRSTRCARRARPRRCALEDMPDEIEPPLEHAVREFLAERGVGSTVDDVADVRDLARR